MLRSTPTPDNSLVPIMMATAQCRSSDVSWHLDASIGRSSGDERERDSAGAQQSLKETASRVAISLTSRSWRSNAAASPSGGQLPISRCCAKRSSFGGTGSASSSSLTFSESPTSSRVRTRPRWSSFAAIDEPVGRVSSSVRYSSSSRPPRSFSPSPDSTSVGGLYRQRSGSSRG